MKHGNERKGRFPIFRERLNILLGDMSTTDFADKVDVSRQTMGFYLNGERIPDSLTLERICKVCNVTSDWLLGLTDDQKPKPCAVDELGLSPSVVKKIKTSMEWNKEEFSDKSLNEKVKSCFFDNCYSTHGAFNIVLEKTIDSPIYTLIAMLARRIYDRKNVSIPDDLQPCEFLSSQIGKDAAQSASIDAKLTYELYDRHPELNYYFHVVSGAECARMDIDHICNIFRTIIEEITGYNDYFKEYTNHSNAE